MEGFEWILTGSVGGGTGYQLFLKWISDRQAPDKYCHCVTV